MTEHLFQTEFGSEVQLPSALLEGLARGELLDTSWHNDACPSFQHRDAPYLDDDQRELRLWVQPERPEDREFPTAERYCVHRLDQDCPLYAGEDLNAALTVLRTEAAAIRRQREQEGR